MSIQLPDLRLEDFLFLDSFLRLGGKGPVLTSLSVPQGSSSSFLFGSGPPALAAGPAFGASQAPTFGPSPSSGQQSAPSFGSLSTPLFSAGSHPAPSAFGSVTSSTQPPVFGQQAAQQPAFGSAAPTTGECRPSSSLLVSKIMYFIFFFMKRTINYMEKDDFGIACVFIYRNCLP